MFVNFPRCSPTPARLSKKEDPTRDFFSPGERRLGSPGRDPNSPGSSISFFFFYKQKISTHVLFPPGGSPFIFDGDNCFYRQDACNHIGISGRTGLFSYLQPGPSSKNRLAERLSRLSFPPGTESGKKRSSPFNRDPTSPGNTHKALSPQFLILFLGAPSL